MAINRNYSKDQKLIDVKIKDRFGPFLDKEEDFEKLKKIAFEIDFDVNEWKDEAKEQMIYVFLKRETDFAGLNEDKIDTLIKDYQTLKERKLVAPKLLNNEIVDDLQKVWNDDKSRLCFLAYHGTKQLKRFSQRAEKFLKFLYPDKFKGLFSIFDSLDYFKNRFFEIN